MKFRSKSLNVYTKLWLNIFLVLLLSGYLTLGSYFFLLSGVTANSDHSLLPHDSNSKSSNLRLFIDSSDSDPSIKLEKAVRSDKTSNLLSASPIVAPLDESESWSNEYLYADRWVAAYWFNIGPDYKYEWQFSSSDLNIEVWAFNSSEFSDFDLYRNAWGYKLSDGTTTIDSDTWYPPYTETWYIVFWNNGASGRTIYSASVTLIWLGEITVTNPSTSDTWTLGQTYDIEWISSHTSPTDPNPFVSIELYEVILSPPSTNWVLNIISSTSNDGSYSWTLPSSLPIPSLDSVGYGINISSTNEPSKVYDLSGTFNILGGPVAPALSSPVNDTTITNSSPQLRWGAVSDAVEYQLQVDNSSTSFNSLVINETTPNTAYDATNLIEGTYFWRVRGKNNTDFWGAWSFPWSFAIKLMSITITSPTGSDQWVIGSTHEITWNSVGNITWVDIVLYNGTSNLLGPIAYDEANDGSYSWTIPWGILDE
ncbi:MAG: Ser-Thr-rich GPI-anchored membrane family protein, partial [Candidatus Hodarchaeota archaeon]